MRIRLFIFMAIFLVGCQTPSAFVDAGVGYTRFEIDDIGEKVTVDDKSGTTRIKHADAFMMKARLGTMPIEALPQFRTGLELRGGLGGAYDTSKIEDRKDKAFTDFTVLMIGIGSFASWKQKFGKNFFIEAGAIANIHSVGVKEYGRKIKDTYFEEDEEGAGGWSVGGFGKIGIEREETFPTSFSLEFGYEAGKWDFDGDTGDIDAKSLTFLFSADVEF